MTSPESYLGRYIDFDGAYGNQCVDFVNQYARDNGLPIFTGDTGADVMYGQSPSAYTWVKNSPSAVPPAGAIVIWGRSIGPWGHIAIARPGSDTNTLRTVDQNWNYHPYVERVDHNYNGVIGWGIPKASEGEEGVKIGNGENWYARLNQLHIQLLGSEFPRKDFGAWVGQDTLKFIEAVSDNPIASQRGNIATVAIRDKWDQQIYDLQAQVRASNENVTKLQTQVKDLSEKVSTQSDDTKLLNGFGEFLSKLIIRLGLKK